MPVVAEEQVHSASGDAGQGDTASGDKQNGHRRFLA
jgi:hypothetical protein